MNACATGKYLQASIILIELVNYLNWTSNKNLKRIVAYVGIKFSKTASGMPFDCYDNVQNLKNFLTEINQLKNSCLVKYRPALFNCTFMKDKIIQIT